MRFNLDNYETVEARLAKFWEMYPNGQVFTAIHHYDDNKVVFRAEIYKDISDPRPVATGYAELAGPWPTLYSSQRLHLAHLVRR